MKQKHLILVFLICTLFFGISSVFPQIKEEKEERTPQAKIISEDLPDYKISHRAAIFSGYDSNVNLSSERRGDAFTEFLYSLDFSKPLFEDVIFLFDYDFDVLNYSEFTDSSNILNHLKFTLYKNFKSARVGGGYDFGALYYPRNEDGNFLFHKGFIYFQKNLSQKTYHKIQFEYGLKDYTDQNALADTISTYQNKDRLDRRLSASYAIRSKILPKLTVGFKTKFSTNESNSRYLDFYDYLSWKQTLSLDYKLIKDFYLACKFSYRRKEYDARNITIGGKLQNDDLYVGTLGFVYRLNRQQSLSLHYTYRQNNSNDSLEEYSESLITCGWQYNF